MNEKENTYRRIRYNSIQKKDPIWVSKHNAKRRKYKDKHRETIVEILGGNKCSCKGINCWHEGECIVNDRRCIQIDHINDDGHKERRSVTDYRQVYVKYSNNPEMVKQNLQLLCANCNWVKRFNRIKTFILPEETPISI